MVGGGLHEAEDGSVERGIGGSKVVEGKVVLGGGEYFGQVKLRVRGVADSKNRARVKSGCGYEIVLWWGWVRGSAVWACVDNGPLKFTSRTFLFHFVGGGRKDARDAAGSSPSNDVIGAASGSKKLRVSWGYVDFYPIIEGKSLGGAMHV